MSLAATCGSTGRDTHLMGMAQETACAQKVAVHVVLQDTVPRFLRDGGGGSGLRVGVGLSTRPWCAERQTPRAVPPHFNVSTSRDDRATQVRSPSRRVPSAPSGCYTREKPPQRAPGTWATSDAIRCARPSTSPQVVPYSMVVPEWKARGVTSRATDDNDPVANTWRAGGAA